jgi:uncharacterized protein (DUF3820 family)
MSKGETMGIMPGGGPLVEELPTVEEVADRLRIEAEEARRLIVDEGQMPHFSYCGRVVVDVDDMESFLMWHVVKAPPVTRAARLGQRRC